MSKLESRVSKVEFHVRKIEVAWAARAKLNSREVKSKTPENVRMSQLPNFPTLNMLMLKLPIPIVLVEDFDRMCFPGSSWIASNRQQLKTWGYFKSWILNNQNQQYCIKELDKLSCLSVGPDRLVCKEWQMF